jgi:hypothetical protein
MKDETIIISKLCCPACWELIDILRGKTKRFNVRGRHPTLYPVELPAYLSQQVLSEMITRFKEFLYNEIDVMMMSEELIRAPSRQSISNSSTGSQEDEPPVSTVDDDEMDNPLVSVANLFGSDDPDYQFDETSSSEYLSQDKANSDQATSTPFVSAETSSLSALT